MSRNETPRGFPTVPNAVVAGLALLAFSLALSPAARAGGGPATAALPPNPSAVAGSSTPTAANAAPRVVFAGSPLPVSNPASAPYRDPVDGTLCVTPQSLAPLGVTYIIDEKANVATFAGPDGVATVTVPLRTPPGGAGIANGAARNGIFVPAVDTIEGLGGKCEWYPATNTLMARAVLTSVEMLGGQLRIKATLPVTPTITDLKEGRLIVIDVVGAEVGKLPHQLDLQTPTVAQARSGQFHDDVARIVLEMKQPYAFSVLGGKPSLQMILNPTSPATAVAASTPPASATAGNGAGQHARPLHGGKMTAVSLVSGVTFRKIADDQAQFIISADRAPTIRAALTRGRLTLDLINATLGSAVPDLSKIDHPFLKAVHLLANGTSAAQLVLDLTRAVVYTIRPTDKGPVELDLSLPRGAVGKLSGKTIVVDAGHGGHDSGAAGTNGSVEKNVTLAIATQLADTLRDAGANVIMTRSTDYFIPVDERPAIANRAGADFFVSVHADSGDRNHSIKGSTVYYHFNQPSCRILAQCVADRMAEVGDIRSRGIGSDGIRFPGVGYGVLRNSQMVAMLVECGYMSNGEDVRKLNTPAVQKRIAQAIVGGIRDYIEGNPLEDTRNVNPQPSGGIVVPPTPSSVSPDGPVVDPAGNAPAGDPNAPPAPDTRVVPVATPDDSIAGSR